MAPALPYWRLSSFYFFFFAALGALIPYWGPYLRQLGFSSAEIGQLLAILHATKIIAPNVWGWLADHMGRRMLIVRVAALAAMVLFAGALVEGGFWWMALVMAGFSFFWNAALPQFEANTFNHLGQRPQVYSLVRLWGSVGFIVTVIGFGRAVDHFGLDLLPWGLLLLFAGLWLSALIAPEGRNGRGDGDHAPFLAVLKQPHVLGFLLACMLLQASHGPFYAFFSIYLEDHGYSGGTIGVLWAVGVVAEVLLFLIMHRLLPRYGPRLLLTVALVLAVVRWLLLGAFVDSLALVALSQTLHAATFGVYHAVGIHTINRYFVGGNQGRGQALYSSLTFGAGVALGSLVAGWLWDDWGGHTYYLGALVAAVAAILAWMSLQREAH